MIYHKLDRNIDFPVKAEIASVGAGVQSFCMFIQSCLGFLPRIDCGIFADTGWERRRTYDAVEFLKEFGDKHGIPLYTVQHSNIREDMINPKTYGHMPVFIRNAKGDLAQLRRQCTYDYKIRPVQKLIDELYKPCRKNPVAQWIGISLDEASRMRTPHVHRFYHRYPLVENRISRSGCYEWLKKNDFPIPVKSSCIGCPYHHDSTWASLDTEELEDVVDFDDKIRHRPIGSPINTSQREHKNRPDPNVLELFHVPEPEGYKEQAGIMDDRQYLHRSLTPMREKPWLRKAPQKNQEQIQFPTESNACSHGCFH